MVITRGGRLLPKLLDFGIAKQLESLDQGDDQTRTGLRLLTPAYAAPEVVGGDWNEPKSDIYALGITLYELIAGRPPFHDDNTAIVLHRQLHDAPMPLCDIRPDVPSAFEAVIDGARPMRRFWTIVFPLLSPTTFFLLVVNIVYVFFDTCVYHQPGIDLLTKVIPVDNILFASEMIGAVRGIDPDTGHYYDDTKRYVLATPNLSDEQRYKVFEGNARRVFSRMDAALKAKGI